MKSLKKRGPHVLDDLMTSYFPYTSYSSIAYSSNDAHITYKNAHSQQVGAHFVIRYTRSAKFGTTGFSKQLKHQSKPSTMKAYQCRLV